MTIHSVTAQLIQIALPVLSLSCWFYFFFIRILELTKDEMGWHMKIVVSILTFVFFAFIGFGPSIYFAIECYGRIVSGCVLWDK